jgi:A1 cistron-splicing factor AAR2
MDTLTPQQAQALWDAGGFLLLTNLPEGSEYGIDGTYVHTPLYLPLTADFQSYNQVRRFSGTKFLPPGLHLITWSPPSSSTSGPSAIPVRSAYLRVFDARERVVLQYDQKLENVPLDAPSQGTNGGTSVVAISDDHLKSLDKEFAPYPFTGMEIWRAMSLGITQDMVDDVLGDGRVDGLTQGDVDEDEVSELVLKDGLSAGLERTRGEKTMRFPHFRLRRSWRAGAVGEEITRYAQDKSWLRDEVVGSFSPPGG